VYEEKENSMHNKITLGLTGIACLSLAACNSTQKTQVIPMTPIEPPPAVAESPVETPTVKALGIGDTAPAISIDHWVKGGAIDGFEDGQVYVMEFWATWCGPCITSMPHLSGLQEEYGDDVKIIGVSSEEELEIVTGFLAEINKRDDTLNDNRMRYTVAVDPDRSTSDAFMKAAGQNGIPTAFIIDANGKVAWIGHPMGMDGPLAEVVNGTWDMTAAIEANSKEKEQMVAMRASRMTMRKAQIAEDWDWYIETIDTYTAENGYTPALADMKFNALLEGKKDKIGAYVWAEEMVKKDWDNPSALNAMAWGIVDEMPAEQQNLDFALKVADRACELTDYKDAMILDTLARCYWEMGDRYKAIAWQEKAVENAEESSMTDSIRATLDEYQATLANVDE
jgi:thiol-disulfide isomerase/thioredoxin